MNIKEILKRTIFALSGISLIIVFTFCGNEEEVKEDDSDTLQTVEVTKSREDLIVNRDTMMIKHPEEMNEFEQKHTPDIILGEINEENLTEVKVKVGLNGIVHPSEDNHWIDYMKVFLDDTEVEFKEFQNGPGSNETSFLLDLTDKKEVTVELGCNIHGIWFNSLILEQI
jgi:superoxide reductase